MADVSDRPARRVGQVVPSSSNYQSFEIVGDRGVMKVRHTPTPEQLRALSEDVPMFASAPGYRVDNDSTISFNFDGRNYVSLRLVIDEVNSWAV
jgi:hypothetical protein